MKYFRILLWVLLAITRPLPAQQNLQWQAELGVAVSSFPARSENSIMPGYLNSHQTQGFYSPLIGLHATMELRKGWSAGMGAQWQQCGSIFTHTTIVEYKSSTTGAIIHALRREVEDYRFSKIAIPMEWTFSRKREKNTWTFLAGMRTNYFIGGRDIYTVHTEGDSMKTSTDSDVQNPFDPGYFTPLRRIRLQGGLGLGLSRGRFTLQTAFYLGRNLYWSSFDPKNCDCILSEMLHMDLLLSLRYTLNKRQM